MTHWALDIWKVAYLNAVGDSAPTSWRDLYSEENLNKLLANLDVLQPANVFPAKSWGNHINDEYRKIHDHAEKVLERHSGFLDPNIHRAIYAVIYNSQLDMLPAIQRIGVLQNIPYLSNLGSRWAFPQDWLDAVIEMHEWTIQTHSFLLANKVSKIHEPYLFKPFTSNEHPKARITPEEF